MLTNRCVLDTVILFTLHTHVCVQRNVKKEKAKPLNITLDVCPIKFQISL